MAVAPKTAGPYADLLTWLEDHNVPFELHEHPLSFTAEATARVEGVDPRAFAKVVGVREASGDTMLVVVDASDEVDLVRLAGFLGVDWVTVLTESEMRSEFPECEAGAIPPVPELARRPVYADEAVRADGQITFHAGSHRHTVRVTRPDWERAAGIRYGAFAHARRA
jgi:Ala-tRNA(Pro) deacylase